MKQDNHVHEVFRHGRAIKDETGALLGEAQLAAQEIGRRLDIPGRMERSPYQTVAVAFGVGYVLGGGLFTALTSRALRLGVKVVLLPMLNAKLVELGEAAMQGAAAVQGQSGFAQGFQGPDGPGKA